MGGFLGWFGAEGQSRTADTGLFRAVLYQLSYLSGERTSIGFSPSVSMNFTPNFFAFLPSPKRSGTRRFTTGPRSVPGHRPGTLLVGSRPGVDLARHSPVRGRTSTWHVTRRGRASTKHVTRRPGRDFPEAVRWARRLSGHTRISVRASQTGAVAVPEQNPLPRAPPGRAGWWRRGSVGNG